MNALAPGIRRARSMSVCCDSDVRGQVTSELFGMNGIAVHALTLTVNTATGSRFNLAVWQRRTRDCQFRKEHQRNTGAMPGGGPLTQSQATGIFIVAATAAVRLARTWWPALRIVEQAGNLGFYASGGFLNAVDIAIEPWWCTVPERG